MNRRFHLLSLPVEYDQAIPLVLDALSAAGFQTVLSFDLKVARATHKGCSCPNHGTKKCGCQMAVFMVYRNGLSPASIVAHGWDGRSQFQLVDSPDQQPEAGFETAIRGALAGITLPRSLAQSKDNDQ